MSEGCHDRRHRDPRGVAEMQTEKDAVRGDGQPFLVVQVTERLPIKATQVILVQNWLEELKRRVPTK